MPMTPSEIKRELKNRGLTQVMIANAVKPKVSATHMGRVINGRDPSPRLREAVARMLCIPIEQLWPPSPDEQNAA